VPARFVEGDFVERRALQPDGQVPRCSAGARCSNATGWSTPPSPSHERRRRAGPRDRHNSKTRRRLDRCRCGRSCTSTWTRFYASVRAADDPSLRGKPVLVGGKVRSRRCHGGIVRSATLRGALRDAHGARLRRCPQAIVVPPHMEPLRRGERDRLRGAPNVHPAGRGPLARRGFLDVTASQSLFGDGPTIAAKIKAAIRDKTELRASGGRCTDEVRRQDSPATSEKPDGLVVVPPSVWRRISRPLPIERMWGIG